MNTELASPDASQKATSSHATFGVLSPAEISCDVWMQTEALLLYFGTPEWVVVVPIWTWKSLKVFVTCGRQMETQVEKLRSISTQMLLFLNRTGQI